MNQYDPLIPEPKSKSSNKWLWIALGGCLVMFACLTFTAVLGIVGYFYFQETNQTAVSEIQLTRDLQVTRRAAESATPLPPETPTTTARATDIPATPTAEITIIPTSELNLSVPDTIDTSPIPQQARDDLEKLFQTHYPSNDYFEPAQRLGKLNLGARTVVGPAYQIGDTRSFYNGDKEIEATLMAMTAHMYFWAENGLGLDQTAVSAAADRFETEYYPQIINLFGDVWTPGIDGDSHFSVLHTNDDSEDELGRFNSTDEYPQTLYDQSNEQEMLYMNLDALDLGSDLYFGTLVHELQHLIQWYVDPSEDLWVNEGLSQLAEIYVGLETADTYDYLVDSSTQLNSWNFDDDKVYAHYAASYLFMVYLWEQLGDAAIQEYSRHPANGMAGVRAVLEGYRPDTTLEQFFADWTAANYLDDRAADPRYYYDTLDFRHPTFEDAVSEPTFETTNTLPQYGAHYYDLNDLHGETTISFAGDTLVELTDSAPRSGSTMWYAPAVNEMNAQLTGSFDLTELDQATLKYSVWHDLEVDYDYAYVSISDDGGATWDLLAPDGSSVGEYGPAYNGRSDEKPDSRSGWIKDSVSLNLYTGKSVLIRFEVLTDSDVVESGFAIDDISIPELKYYSDVESGPDGWQANGFVQMGWFLPQQWMVQLIVAGPDPKVTTIPLNEFNQGEWTTDIGKGGGVLVVTPLTPFNNETADYWLHIDQ